MASTYTFAADEVPTVYGNKRVESGLLTIAGTYTTGGDAIPQTLFRMATVDRIVFEDGATSIGQVPIYDRPNRKLKLFRYDGASAGKANLEEVAAAVATAGTIRISAYGTGL